MLFVSNASSLALRAFLNCCSRFKETWWRNKTHISTFFSLVMFVILKVECELTFIVKISDSVRARYNQIIRIETEWNVMERVSSLIVSTAQNEVLLKNFWIKLNLVRYRSWKTNSIESSLLKLVLMTSTSCWLFTYHDVVFSSKDNRE